MLFATNRWWLYDSKKNAGNSIYFSVESPFIFSFLTMSEYASVMGIVPPVESEPSVENQGSSSSSSTNKFGTSNETYLLAKRAGEIVLMTTGLLVLIKKKDTPLSSLHLQVLLMPLMGNERLKQLRQNKSKQIKFAS